MARPWKHPKTGIDWRRRAVPAELRDLSASASKSLAWNSEILLVFRERLKGGRLLFVSRSNSGVCSSRVQKKLVPVRPAPPSPPTRSRSHPAGSVHGQLDFSMERSTRFSERKRSNHVFRLQSIRKRV